MRAFGRPSASTVASVIALASDGSERWRLLEPGREQPQRLVGFGEITGR